MRRAAYLRSSTLVLLTSAALAAGCADTNVCDYAECGSVDGSVDGGADGAVVDAGDAGADATARDGGEAGPGDAGAEAEAAPPSCNLAADPKDDAALCVTDAVGVFVDATHGLDTNTGTKASPWKTIGKAVAAAPSRVYICAGTYPAAVNVTSSVSLYGGWSCSDWSYSASNAVVIAPTAAGAALTLSHVGGVFVEDLEVDALAGTAATPSSVAALVASSTGVTFRRVTLKAGPGLGATASAGTTNWTAATAPSGNAPTGATGGAGGVNPCTDGSAPAGGNGGNATADGTNGTPPNAAGSADGYDGALGKGSSGTGCGAGSDVGANGSPAATAAAGATTWGTLSAAGWTPSNGAAGPNGGPGQGGGGAGGKNTSGGGGGGAGGCGGAGGAAGIAGGSSFALLSFMSTVTVDSSTFTAAAAGSGAAGASGQNGQGGGAFATGAFCNAATGGNGAGGAGGGGGAGGLSVAIGYLGTAPTQVGTVTLTVASSAATGGGASTGGAEGNNADGNTYAPTAPGGAAGKNGLAVMTQDLTP